MNNYKLSFIFFSHVIFILNDFSYLIRLQEYNKKLVKVKDVQKEIKNHLNNLPDLTQLPDVTGGLAPLPSAGDLFNVHSA